MEDKEFEEKFNSDAGIQELIYLINKSYDECINLVELERTNLIINKNIEFNVQRIKIMYLLNFCSSESKGFLLRLEDKLKSLSNEKYNQCVLKLNIN